MSVNPRESMRPVWPCLQPFLTRLTGVPLSGEVTTKLTPWDHLRGAASFLSCGLLLSAWSAEFLRPLTVPTLMLGWLFTLHGARKMRTIVMHQAAHRNFVRKEGIDRPLGKLISIVLVAEEFDSYRKSHCADHHSSRHQTIDDPTVAFLFNDVHLRPGLSCKQMWTRLLATVVSPAYHARFLWSRFQSHFKGTSNRHRLAFCCYLVAVVAAVSLCGAWNVLVLAWLFPVGILYQVSTAFRLSSEHVFPEQLPPVRNRATIGAFTLAIFSGAPAPAECSSQPVRFLMWIWWWTRILGFHLPCRLAFLPGDGPVHDWHHRHPMSPDWANYIQNRASDAGQIGNTTLSYSEVWGFHRAIDACFTSLSKANPSDYAITRVLT